MDRCSWWNTSASAGANRICQNDSRTWPDRLGHWWEFARKLLPALGDSSPAERFRAARDLLLGPARDDLPRAAGLDAALREVLEGSAGARTTVRLADLFGRLVRYRNQELGHGAAGQHSPQFYETMGAALFAGICEILGKLDLLAGGRLIYIGEVRRQVSGNWLLNVMSFPARARGGSSRSKSPKPSGPLVDFLLCFEGKNADLTGYAVGAITSERARRVKCLVGSDDALRLSLKTGSW